MRIGGLSKQTKLSVHTLRYYEKIGLLPKVPRNDSGHREYGEDALVWLNFIEKLKITGMPLSRIKEYANLRARGEATSRQRRDILLAHQSDIHRKIEDLKAIDAMLYQKIEAYNQTIER